MLQALNLPFWLLQGVQHEGESCNSQVGLSEAALRCLQTQTTLATSTHTESYSISCFEQIHVVVSESIIFMKLLTSYLKVSQVFMQNDYINIYNLLFYRTSLLQPTLLWARTWSHCFDTARQVCLSCSICLAEVWGGEFLYLIRDKFAHVKVAPWHTDHRVVTNH